jgi:hypothetical protein
MDDLFGIPLMAVQHDFAAWSREFYTIWPYITFTYRRCHIWISKAAEIFGRKQLLRSKPRISHLSIDPRDYSIIVSALSIFVGPVLPGFDGATLHLFCGGFGMTNNFSGGFVKNRTAGVSFPQDALGQIGCGYRMKCLPPN